MSFEDISKQSINLDDLIFSTREEIWILKSNLDKKNNQENFAKTENLLSQLDYHKLEATEYQRNQIDQLKAEFDVLSEIQESIIVLKRSVNSTSWKKQTRNSSTLDDYSPPVIKLDPNLFDRDEVVLARNESGNRVKEQTKKWRLSGAVTNRFKSIWITDLDQAA